MLDALIFDIGDTLIHFDVSRPRAFLSAATEPAHQWLRERGELLPGIGRYERKIWWKFVRSFVWSRVTRREICLVVTMQAVHRRFGLALGDDELLAVMRRVAPSLRPFFTVDAQAVSVARRLRARGFKLGLISNTFFPGCVIDDVLAEEGLLDFFPVRVYSSDVRYMKPHARIFRRALDLMDVAPERTMYIGDRLKNDVKGPARLGMKTAWMAGSKAVSERGVRPDHVVRCLGDVLPIVGADSPNEPQPAS